MAEQHLTMDMPRSAVDRTQAGAYGGSIALVVLMALVLVAAAAGLLFIGRTNAGPYILGLLSVLSMVGVFLLFAIAAGLLRMPGKETVSPLIKSVVDGANDGILITDSGGRVLYANAAYMALVDGGDDVRPIERAFVGDSGVSEAVYRRL